MLSRIFKFTFLNINFSEKYKFSVEMNSNDDIFGTAFGDESSIMITGSIV